MYMNSRVTVGHLRAAVLVGETSSFTESANMLGLSQSSLSRRISDLEKILQVQLFHRTTRSVEPTSSGKDLLAQMRATLVGFDKGVEQLHQQASGDTGSIAIGCLPSIAATFLPNLIRDFIREHPGVRVEVRDALTTQVIEQVRAGDVDFGITAASSPEPDLAYEHVGADQFYCALPHWHELATLDSADWEMLRNERVITFSPFTSISRPVKTALEAAGVDTDSAMVGHNVGAVAGLVASGLGVTVVPGLVRPLMEFAQLAFVPLRPVTRREIFVIRRKGERSSPAVEHFIRPMRVDHEFLEQEGRSCGKPVERSFKVR